MSNNGVMRVGVVADLLEEGWPSMDLVADMLLMHLGQPAGAVEPVLLRPALRPRLGRLLGGRVRTIDRIANRFYDYPRWLRGQSARADVFHIIDHSYSHLVEELPRGRVVVTCHDTDAFLPILNGISSESMLPKRFVRRLARGLQRADVVACVSEATERALICSGLVPPERIRVVRNGVHPACSPEPDVAADHAATSMLGPVAGPELLHVGSTAPRKRIDVLLRTLRAVADVRADVRLVRVGGPFGAAHEKLAADLGIGDRIVVLPALDRPVLSAVYRRAAIVLLPSEREGFGLPVVEALACGTPVVATDLAVLREVGGTALTYAPLGDVAVWRDAIGRLLDERERDSRAWASRRAAGLQHASLFSWQRFAAEMTAIYARLA